MANVKRGGRALTGILCFIFGFIFAIIAEVAVIAAGIYYLLNTDLEDIFSTVGIENTDGDSYVYIDTSKITDISDLIGAISSLASDFDADSTTLKELVDSGFSVVGTAVDKIYDTLSGVLSDYMTEDEFAQIFDKDTLMSTTISGLSGFITDSLLSVNVEIIFNIADIKVEENALFMALAYGAKATVGTYNGNTVPLSVETLTKAETETVAEIATYSLSEGSTYIREDDTYLSSDYDEYVVEESNGTYALYCYVAEDGVYVAQYDEENDTFTVTTVEYEQYSEDYTTISGAYYYDGSTLEIISKHTLGDYVGADADITAVFDDIYISDLVSGSLDDDTLLSLLGDYSIGDIINGNIDFDDIMGSVYIADFIDISPDDTIMMYFGYAITGVEAVQGEDYSYTGTINFYEDDKADATAYIVVGEDGYVSSVYYYENGEEIEYYGVSASDLSVITENFMDALTVGDVIEITEEDSKLLQKLGDYKLSKISDAMDDIVLSDVIEDVYTDDSIIAYMVYGINNISVDNSTGAWTATYHCLDEDCSCDGTHDVTVDVTTVYDNDGNVSYLITKVYYTESGEEVEAGTKLDEVSDRISAMLDDLTIGEIIDEDDIAGNTILEALSGSTINSLSTDIQNLTIQELFADEIYGGKVRYSVDSDSFDSTYLYYYYDEDSKEYVFIGHLDGYTTDYGILYTYGEITTVWKLLLYTTDDDGNAYEDAVTINAVTSMQDNLVGNLGNATINDLVSWEILKIDEDDLKTPIGDSTLGELTLSNFISMSVSSLTDGND